MAGLRGVAWAAHEERLSVVVTRADGRAEDRGVWAYHGPSPVKRLGWGVWLAIKAQYWTWRERQYLKTVSNKE